MNRRSFIPPRSPMYLGECEPGDAALWPMFWRQLVAAKRPIKTFGAWLRRLEGQRRRRANKTEQGAK